MRALVCHAYGPIDSLRLEDVPRPQPAPGEVLVKVGAAGVSFAAMLGIQGKHQNKPPLPFVPGNEIAGEVVALGDGVGDLKVGDRIATGGSRGGFAEYCVTIAANAVTIPDALPYAEATNFPTLYPTAYGALKWKANLLPGEVLLVHGAGGGSGLTGIEVGKAMGATVIASAGGADKLAAAKDAGADHLIDYRLEDLRTRVLELTGGRGADVIYDPVGGDAFAASMRCVAPEGRIIPMGFASGTIPQIPANILLVKNVTVIGFYYGYWNGWGGKTEPTPKEAVALAHRRAMVADAQAELTRWFIEGKLKALVAAKYDLADWVKAFKLIEDRAVVGKAVLSAVKKLINDPRAVVRELLEGLADLRPGLALLESENVIVRAGLPPAAQRPIALLSGGGSGHEPAHAGYVGDGMLTAAVAGEVFTSPSVDAVLAGIRTASGPAGAILIVKNYTGDRLNFGLAAELARADGIPVEEVIVADDVALAGTVANDRRRGIAGTVLVHKIAGAAAAAGRSLAEVARVARSVAADVGTMGVALGACTVPAAGRSGFELGPNEIELGLGIHGEAGVERAPMMPADALVERLLSSILSDRQLVAGDRVALLVNGLGGTTPMELAIVARHAIAVLRTRGLSVERAWAGTFMTALEMPGVSLSLLRLDDERLALLDAATTAPAWPGSGKIAPRAVVTTPSVPQDSRPTGGKPADPRLSEALVAVAAALEAAEGTLTDLDSRAGDGDLGASMVRAAEALRTLAREPWSDPATLLAATADALRRAIGGSSGPFYATGLLRAARRLPSPPKPSDWAQAFEDGVAAIEALGGARPGDRTMIDALAPAAGAVARQVSSGAPLDEILKAAALAAETGADATAGMPPRLGRASYLGQRALGVADGGAVAVAIWLRALADHF